MPKHKKTIIEYRNYNLNSSFPVLLLSGNRWRISDVKSDRLHFHNCLEIGICHSDSGIMEFDNSPIPFYKGDITFVNKNFPHTTYSNKGTASLWSYIFYDPDELFRNFSSNVYNKLDNTANNQSLNYLLMNKESYPNVHYLVHSIIHELSEKPNNYQLNVRSLLLSLHIEMNRIHESNHKVLPVLDAETNTNTKDNSLVITPALDYIRENYMQQFTMEYLATICHFSETHFRRVFHSIMGTSPLNYINNMRISKACSLLRSTEDSILTISEKVGFRSVSSFNRYFQRVIGCSPREWRYQLLHTESKTSKQSIFEYSGWV